MNRLRRDEEGQGLVEYALLVSVIGIGLILSLGFLRDQVAHVFSHIGNNLT